MRNGFARYLVFCCLVSFLSQDAHAQVEPREVSEIRVRGNQLTEESFIITQCGLRVGQRLVAEDTGRAIRNLYSMGLFSDIQILVDTDMEEGLVVEIVVQEYPKLGEVTYEGNRKLKDKSLKKEVDLIRGQLIKPQEEKRAVNSLQELYKEKGYLLAKVQSERAEADSDGRVSLIFKIDEGKKVNLKKIRFHGNEAIRGKELRKQMKETKQDGWWFGGGKYSEEEFPEDKHLVLEYYRQNGYRDAEILSDSLSFDENKEKLYIDITLNEGPIYKFGEISWEGNERITEQGMSRLIVVEKGDVYSSERLAKSREQVSSSYGDIGYITAFVGFRETLVGDHQVDINFSIQENDPWKIRNVIITGNTKTKDQVIRRELWVRPGDIFRRSMIERSVREIMQLNFFANAVPEPRPVEDGSKAELDLIVEVEEKSTGTASVGAGFSEQDGLVGTIALQIPNFRGNGQQLDFQWEFGSRRETFRIGFTEPWLMNTPTSLSASLFRDTQRFSSLSTGIFDQRAQGGSFRVGRRLRWPDFSRVSVGYRIEQVKFINFSDSTQVSNSSLSDNVTSSVNANFSRDTRDLPIFATSGSVFSYTPSVAGGFLGGNRDFHKHDFVTSFYFPLFWRFALNMRSQLGFVVSYGNEPIPFNELYTPGGVSIFDGTMLRGYNDQSVGPQNFGGNIGGVAQLLFNMEITIPMVPGQFYGLLFADAGNAWDHLSKVSMFDVRRSAGFGIRIVAPVVGIMGFDFAWGFDRKRVDGAPVQMMTHFQFGPQFF